jgi:autotransporter-associated beta strand protein
MKQYTRSAPSFGGRNRMLARSFAAASLTAIAVAIISSGTAAAEPAVYFNDDVEAGIETFEDTVAAADAAYNADNPGANRTSHIYAFDILNTTGSSFLVLGTNGAPGVTVKTFRGGSPATNNENGDAGRDGFTNWSNSHNGTFADAESKGYTYEFYEADGTTPFTMNALGTLVNDWGTCCASGNPTPDGNTTNASEVYLRFGTSDPLLLGGISNTIGGTEHFIGAINDTNFFDKVSVIATGNGEYFGVGGYLTFSSVALNSVPAGSSVVDGSGLENPSAQPSIPDIDTGSTYYTAAQLGASQVNPNFVGGTLQFAMDTFALTDFTVQSQGGTIDTEGNVIELLGQFTGAGTISKTGAGMLYLAGNNTNQGGFTILEGTLVAYNDQNLGGGPLTIGNGTFQQETSGFSSYHDMIVQDANSTVNVQNGQMNWYGNVSGNGALNLAGTGSLWLSGTNTYTGGTTIQQGTLIGSTRSLQGDILNNGMIEFSQYFDGTFNGSLSGTGGLRKYGDSILRIAGTSRLGGNSFVEAGSLDVNGVFGSNLLTVLDGASLLGTGGVDGSVLVLTGGMLKPGNSPGTLFVSGDVTLSDGSLFFTEIDGRNYSAAGGAGSYDRLVLTGTGATFTANGSINPVLRGISGDANNDFNAEIGDVFTVVMADNIAGTFDAIDQPAAGIPANTRFNLIYNQDSIQLALVAQSLAVLAQDGGLRTNAVATATALDQATANGQYTTGVLTDMFENFNGMNASQINAALASLSGDIHAHVLESTESIIAGSDSMILSAARGDTGIGGVDTELKNGIHLWSRADARGASYDPDAAGMGFDEDVYGITIGATFINRHDLRVGVAGSYKTAEIYNDTANGATNQMLSAYLYGSRAVTTRLTLSGLVGHTQAAVKTSRTTVFPDTVAHTKSDKPVSMTHAQIEARYKAATIGETSVYAIGGLRTAFLNVHKYAEVGNLNEARLTLEAESRNTLQSKLGAEIAREVAGTDVAVFADWTRDIGADPTVERTVWLGDAVWQTQSTSRGLDTYNYGFSARRKVNDRIGLELEYTGRYNTSNYDAQQLMFGVNVVW